MIFVSSAPALADTARWWVDALESSGVPATCGPFDDAQTRADKIRSCTCVLVVDRRVGRYVANAIDESDVAAGVPVMRVSDQHAVRQLFSTARKRAEADAAMRTAYPTPKMEYPY